jgi:hypothetical protein
VPGNVETKLLGLGRARASYQEKRLVKTSLETAEFHLPLAFWFASAAFT